MPLLDSLASQLHVPRNQWTGQHTIYLFGGCFLGPRPPFEWSQKVMSILLHMPLAFT